MTSTKEDEPSVSERTIVALSLPPRARAADIGGFFDHHAGRVRNVRIVRAGIAHVEMNSLRGVERALLASGRPLLGRPVLVKPLHPPRSKRSREPTESTISTESTVSHEAARCGTVTTLFLAVDVTVTDMDVVDLVSPFGPVASVRCEEANCVNGAVLHVWVTFADPSVALKAVEVLDGMIVGRLRVRAGTCHEAIQVVEQRAAKMRALESSLNVQSPDVWAWVQLDNMFEAFSAAFDVMGLKKEVAEEARQFGHLKKVVVRVQTGRVYILFLHPIAARKCQETFHERWFDGRLIQARVVQNIPPR